MPLTPQSATAERQAQPVSPVNARVSVRTGALVFTGVPHHTHLSSRMLHASLW